MAKTKEQRRARPVPPPSNYHSQNNQPCLVGSLWFPSVPVGYQLGTNGLTDWYPTGPLKLPCRDIQCHDRYQLLISRN